MRKRESIKREHERAVASQLLEALQANTSFERFGDPTKREPDVIYTYNGSTLGIEVSTAYYGERDAQDEWEIATGERPLAPEEIRPSGVIGNPDQTIQDRVQTELDDKCAKVYAGSNEAWLCINLNAALSDAQSVAACAKELQVPQRHRFARIYLSYTAPEHEGGKYTAIRIY